jgi:amidase
VCRSVRDCAGILDAIAGPEPGDPYVAPSPARPYREEVGADPGRLRVGLLTTPPGGQFEAHPDVVAGARAAASLLEELGHDVTLEHPPELDDPEYVRTFIVRWSAGVAWSLGWWERRTGRSIGTDDVEPCTWALAEMGRSHTAPDYLRAVEHHQLASRAAARWHERFDLMLTPTLGEPPTRIGEYASDPDNPLAPLARSTPIATFTGVCNLTGQPAISLPLHWSDDGLPIGAQLVAAYGREDLLLRVAAQLEDARPWADREPAVWAGRATA